VTATAYGSREFTYSVDSDYLRLGSENYVLSQIVQLRTLEFSVDRARHASQRTKRIMATAGGWLFVALCGGCLGGTGSGQGGGSGALGISLVVLATLGAGGLIASFVAQYNKAINKPPIYSLDLVTAGGTQRLVASYDRDAIGALIREVMERISNKSLPAVTHNFFGIQGDLIQQMGYGNVGKAVF
jgi:Family of unknown function (DUF6232)